MVTRVRWVRTNELRRPMPAATTASTAPAIAIVPTFRTNACRMSFSRLGSSGPLFQLQVPSRHTIGWMINAANSNTAVRRL